MDEPVGLALLTRTHALPAVRGVLKPAASLAPLVWFKTGGPAQWLFEPQDADDLSDFLAQLDPDMPVMALGLGSNLIVRDGGVPGVVVRLGKPFARPAFSSHRQRAMRASRGSNFCAPFPAPLVALFA